MSRAVRRTYCVDGKTFEAVVRLADGRLFSTLTSRDITTEFELEARRLSPTEIRLDIDLLGTVRAHVVRDGDTAWVSIKGRTYSVTLEEPGARAAAGGSDEDFATSPMTGTLAKLSVEPGAEVAEGGELFVVEAMKMEYVVKAPRDVVVAEVRGSVGGQVDQGAVVVTFESEGDA